MSTFLELVNDVERESGTISQSQRLTSVAGSPGNRQEKIVHWTAQAWVEIQRERRDWTFLRQQFSGSLAAGQSGYSASELGIGDFGQWDRDEEGGTPYTIYDPALGRADETRLGLVPYPTWLNAFDVGAPVAMRPHIVAIGYDNKLHYGAEPDKTYTVRGWYRRTPQVMSADTDEPIIAEEYHQVIVWRALMMLAESDEAQLAANVALSRYMVLYSTMMREYLPQTELS